MYIRTNDTQEEM